MSMSNAELDAILNDRYRTDQTPYSTVYVALMKVLPDQVGAGGTECSGTGYARQPITRGAGSWTAPAAGTAGKRQITNAAAVSFGTAGADWAPPGDDCDGFALYSAASAGTYIGKGSFTPAVVIQSGNPVDFPIGELKVTAAPA